MPFPLQLVNVDDGDEDDDSRVLVFEDELGFLELPPGGPPLIDLSTTPSLALVLLRQWELLLLL